MEYVFENILSQLISFSLGVVASFIAWFILSRILKPKLIISNKISKLPTIRDDARDVPYQYRIKVANKSRYNVYDVTTQGRIVISGLVNGYPDMPRRFKVYIGNVAYLPPTNKKNNEDGCQFIIALQKKEDFLNSTLGKLYSEKFNLDKKKDKKLLLEDILSLGKEAYLDVSVICTHEFSGARRAFNQKYRLEDIVEGKTFMDFGVDIDLTKSACTEKEGG